jgi:hypothetical protein
MAQVLNGLEGHYGLDEIGLQICSFSNPRPDNRMSSKQHQAWASILLLSTSSDKVIA